MVEHLPNKCKALCSSPSTAIKTEKNYETWVGEFLLTEHHILGKYISFIPKFGNEKFKELKLNKHIGHLDLWR
jgi:hypothetical protein